MVCTIVDILGIDQGMLPPKPSRGGHQDRSEDQGWILTTDQNGPGAAANRTHSGRCFDFATPT
jgi:hypothetical protein